MPSFGEIPSSLPPVNVLSYYSTYTAKDWSRWDGYEPRFAPFCPTQPSDYFPLSSQFHAAYLTAFKQRFARDFLAESYNWFIGMLRGPESSDIYNILKAGDTCYSQLLMHASHALNHAYNMWRDDVQARGMDPDTLEVDWMSLPTVPATAAVIEKWLNLLFDVQNFQHNRVSTPRGEFDTFGCFALIGKYNGSIDPNQHFWYCSNIGQVCCHFAHLLSNQCLRRLRFGIQSSLTALQSWLKGTGEAFQQSTAQWLSRIAGFVSQTGFLVLSERLLKQRGDWSAEDDLQTSDVNNGKWRAEDACDYCHVLVWNFVEQTTQLGIYEHSSCYYSWSIEQLSIAVLNCPNQAIFNQLQQMIQYFYYDIAINFLIPSACISSCTNRNYNLTTGTHSAVDRFDLKLYVEALFDEEVMNQLPKKSQVHCLNRQCQVDDRPAIIMNRIQYASRQCAQLCWLPDEMLTSLTLLNSYRMAEARFGSHGQERMNFITPHFSLGWSGEDQVFTGLNVVFTARLAGKPAPPSQDTCLPWIRFSATQWPEKLFSQKDCLLSNDQLTLRQIVSQYQNCALITHLADASHRDPQGQCALTTNLLLPIHIDGCITCNGEELPLSVGTSLALPANPTLAISHLHTTIIIRLLYSEHAPSVNTSPPQIQHNTDFNVLEGSSCQPYHLMWQIDHAAHESGYARLIVTHRHASSNEGSHPYRLTWLAAAASTHHDNERQSFVSILQSAQYSQSLSNVPPKDEYVEWSTVFSCRVCIANTLTLSVDRTDIRTRNDQDLIYRQGLATLMQKPILQPQFSRRVNEQEILQFRVEEDELAFRHLRLSKEQLFEPHRGKSAVYLDLPYEYAPLNEQSRETTTATKTSFHSHPLNPSINLSQAIPAIPIAYAVPPSHSSSSVAQRAHEAADVPHPYNPAVRPNPIDIVVPAFSSTKRRLERLVNRLIQ